ncbi:MAG: FeoC-like transcriptional regulator [Anaerolineales bacterium]|nr:FeoC-like transcriptional regulator [Anaerolineales bacterium]MDW8227096.1 FeoC-like transcriptional regulator [Anaerolineales bacterium]
MLEQLLAEIRGGGTLEVSVLAKRLNTTPDLVTVMLEHLQRSGYLRSYEPCDDTCNECALKSACRMKDLSSGMRLWQGKGE